MRDGEKNNSLRDANPLLEDICFALDLDTKPEEGWSNYEKRSMRERFRDKAHRKFLAKQPCLVRGRQPTNAHHLGSRSILRSGER